MQPFSSPQNEPRGLLSSLLHTNPPRQAPVHNESAARATTTALMAEHVAVASLRGEVAAAEHAAGEQARRHAAERAADAAAREAKAAREKALLAARESEAQVSARRDSAGRAHAVFSCGNEDKDS